LGDTDQDDEGEEDYQDNEEDDMSVVIAQTRWLRQRYFLTTHTHPHKTMLTHTTAHTTCTHTHTHHISLSLSLSLPSSLSTHTQTHAHTRWCNAENSTTEGNYPRHLSGTRTWMMTWKRGRIKENIFAQVVEELTA
jgi:hypothetical protein